MSVSSKLRLFFFASIFIVICLYTIVLSHKINLVTADLGRHITNGKYVFLDKNILNQNYYSYTNPEFKTLNHHWAAGVVYYLINNSFGIIGVQILSIVISLITLAVFILSQKRGPVYYLLIVPLLFLCLPIFSQRTEIRPESFSYLFIAIFYFLLQKKRNNEISPKYLLLVPLLEVLWVNLHVYFFLGPVMVAVYLLESYLKKDKDTYLYLKLFTLTVLATLINPHTIQGILSPLSMFTNYGYELAENQSVIFMMTHYPRFSYYLFIFVFTILAFSFLLVILKNTKKFSISGFLLGLIFSVMAWKMIRNLAIFSLISIPIIIENFESIKDKIGNFVISVDGKVKKISLNNHVLSKIYFFASVLILFYCLLTNQFRKLPYWGEFGLGLENGNSNAAQFFLDNNLKGPIYNNYDIGGYLIYYLFPREKVYVDNRPEAYPSSFFTDEYVPGQDNESKWQELLKKYNFNVIFFSYKDITPWGIKFINNRINDKDWAPVFLDKDIVILLKRNIQYKQLIDQFEL